MTYKIGQIAAAVQDCRRVGIEESIIIEAIGPPFNPKATERAIDHLSDRLLAFMNSGEIGGAVLNFLIAKMIKAGGSIAGAAPGFDKARRCAAQCGQLWCGPFPLCNK